MAHPTLRNDHHVMLLLEGRRKQEIFSKQLVLCGLGGMYCMYPVKYLHMCSSTTDVQYSTVLVHRYMQVLGGRESLNPSLPTGTRRPILHTKMSPKP